MLHGRPYSLAFIFLNSLDLPFSEGDTPKSLTDEDFKNIPSVIADPDFIIFGSVVKTTGNKAITYIKEGVGSVVFVEEIRNGKKLHAAQSLSKTSRTFNVQSILAAPELYAHSDPSSIKNVDLRSKKVNNNVLLQSEEEQEIRKQYENTDKWLKAPNGAESNLSEKQWLQVRTTNFKKWFGDWENDPENASKVIDENGEPLVVYHGSNNDFTEFISV